MRNLTAKQQARLDSKLTTGAIRESTKVNNLKCEKETLIRNIYKNEDLTQNQKMEKIRQLEITYAEKIKRIDVGSVPLWYKRKFGSL